MATTILYFSWIREAMGTGAEDIDLPAEIETVADLIAWLSGRSSAFDEATADKSLIRVAVDQMHASANTPVTGAGEIAIFPPVTGG